MAMIENMRITAQTESTKEKPSCNTDMKEHGMTTWVTLPADIISRRFGRITASSGFTCVM
jgi:hypothetical protein